MATKDNRKTVVFAPLNWGLGHATRIVPLMEKYIVEKWNVIWVAEGVAYHFLRKEFTSLTHYKSDALELKYASSNLLLSHLFKLLPTFLRNIRKDRKFIDCLFQKQSIDLIISDNRYGFYHPKVKSIILTHQVQLPIDKGFENVGFIAQKIVHKWINRFDQCWIVDKEDNAYAGKLSNSKGLKIPYQYIGLLSRMQKQEMETDIDILIVLSGLEPQRSILENQLIDLFKNTKQKVLFIGGVAEKTRNQKSHIQYQNFADSNTLNQLMNRSKLVVCRSGYSSIMDLIALNQKAILIPTNGQPEQVYLSKIHRNNPLFTSVKSVDELNKLVSLK